VKLLKKRKERSKSGMKKMRWVMWVILWESYKIPRTRKLERGVVL